MDLFSLYTYLDYTDAGICHVSKLLIITIFICYFICHNSQEVFLSLCTVSLTSEHSAGSWKLFVVHRKVQTNIWKYWYMVSSTSVAYQTYTLHYCGYHHNIITLPPYHITTTSPFILLCCPSNACKLNAMYVCSYVPFLSF